MMHFDDDQSWVAHALCAGDEPDALFVQGATQRQVRQRCMNCQVRIECLADALDSEANFGVWGALTERERRAILRRHPEVTHWKTWILTSEDPLAVELRASHLPKIMPLVRA